MANNVSRFFYFLIVIFLFAPAVYAGCAFPKFEDYRVESVYSGANHALRETEGGGDKWSIYRAKAIEGKVNFAGHYILVSGDCGGGAICGEIIDVLNGEVVGSLPNAYEVGGSESEYYDAVFKDWSRLLIVSGVSADPEIDSDGKVMPAQYRTRYYEFLDNKLILIGIDEGR
jgi:hypothetical protein